MASGSTCNGCSPGRGATSTDSGRWPERRRTASVPPSGSPWPVDASPTSRRSARVSSGWWQANAPATVFSPPERNSASAARLACRTAALASTSSTACSTTSSASSACRSAADAASSRSRTCTARPRCGCRLRNVASAPSVNGLERVVRARNRPPMRSAEGAKSAISTCSKRCGSQPLGVELGVLDEGVAPRDLLSEHPCGQRQLPSSAILPPCPAPRSMLHSFAEKAHRGRGAAGSATRGSGAREG